MPLELIFAMILALEIVPGDAGAFSVDVLEDTELTMEIEAEWDGDVARFRNAEEQLVLTVERSLTTAHIYTAFPNDEPPRVLDTSEALEALRSFRAEPVQTISAAADGESDAIDWAIARRDDLYYLGIPSAGTVLVIRTGADT
ncbi:MAG: hypothetical protein ACLFPO_06375 [Spirochaetaceae bacterium]